MSIKEKFDAFVKKNGVPPRYAEVSVFFADGKDKRVDGLFVSMVIDEEAERYDDLILFYFNSLADLISATDEVDFMDFTIIGDSVEFTNTI